MLLRLTKITKRCGSAWCVAKAAARLVQMLPTSARFGSIPVPLQTTREIKERSNVQGQYGDLWTCGRAGCGYTVGLATFDGQGKVNGVNLLITGQRIEASVWVELKRPTYVQCYGCKTLVKIWPSQKA